MWFKIEILVQLLAVIHFKRSECWKPEGDYLFRKDLEHNGNEGFYRLLSNFRHVSTTTPCSLIFHEDGTTTNYAAELMERHGVSLEELREEFCVDNEKHFQQPTFVSPISTTDRSTFPSTRTMFAKPIPETTTESSTEITIEPSTETTTQLGTETTTGLRTETTTGLETETTIGLETETATEFRNETTTELGTETATESEKEVFQITKLEDITSTTSATDEYEKPTTERFWLLDQGENRTADQQNDLMASDDAASYEQQLREAYEDIGALLKQFASDTKNKTKHLKQNVGSNEELDKDLVVGRMFNLPVELKIEVHYNDTYKLYVPHNAVIDSLDREVAITWTSNSDTGRTNFTIFFGRLDEHRKCYFGIMSSDWNLDARAELPNNRGWFYELKQPLMDIEDEINLSSGIKVKMSTLHNGTSILQYIYRDVIGCPVKRGTQLSLVLMSFVIPVTFFVFLIFRAYSVGHYPECHSDFWALRS